MLYIIPGLIGGLLLAGALSLADYVLNATGRTTRRVSRHAFLTTGILAWIVWSVIGIFQDMQNAWGLTPMTIGYFAAWLGLSWARRPAVRAGDHDPVLEGH